MKRDSGRAVLRFAVSALVLWVTLSPMSEAAASKTYPGKIQETLDMQCAPPCTLCHDDPNGGYGTANQPFADAIKVTGPLACCKPDTLPKALAAMEGDSCLTPSAVKDGPCDSDNDKVSDIAELRAGNNPNVAGDASFCVRYGCGARVARGTADFDWVSLLIAGAAAATWIVSSRRSRPPA